MTPPKEPVPPVITTTVSAKADPVIDPALSTSQILRARRVESNREWERAHGSWLRSTTSPTRDASTFVSPPGIARQTSSRYIEHAPAAVRVAPGYGGVLFR